MSKINFDPNNYKKFNDYNYVMSQAFNITCSLCDEQEIEFVVKNSPTPLGRMLKEKNRNLTDKEVEKIATEEIVKWDLLEENNFNNNIATFLCWECWNNLTEQK
ncbi:hypothetical protein [Mycoplasma yeatsii]|uniref:Uncharacterized protein YlaI n=1 Tax=Mycoplasma yeatsii TaxID=51365 RepID=A0ABU0NEF3_9MOLU|nr:hypothetical protein [Mycoplasma yeatsii]MDQ0567831.1 uncharacterized protein YlaI [Mycoplasma yeatsii]